MKKIALFTTFICSINTVLSQSLDVHLNNGDIIKFGSSNFEYVDFSETEDSEESDIVGVYYLRKGLLLEGQFRLYDSGAVKYNQYMSSFVYDNINPNYQYSANGFAVPTSGYDHIAFVHYYNGETWLGYENNLYVERGPYFQTEDVILNVPNYCNKIIIIGIVV